ncbi:MAG: Fe-S cluster assembly ATPase SufC [Actinomycetota bacterium]|nr:Fe-S cluster assembly ATPase SufC [Actinomycetota bacterium]
MGKSLIEIQDLHVCAEDGSGILNGVSLAIGEGEIHALMGPNGCGKSTLASTLLGSPEYIVRSGTILYKGDDITEWSADERGKAGMFLAFQYPQEFPGVSVLNFLRQTIEARTGKEMSILNLRKEMLGWMQRLDIEPAFADRYLNEGFSGGEKKRNEILQMALLQPDFAVLDETDSGLDIDALQIVATGINQIMESNPKVAVLTITHYQRLLDHLQPKHVHVLVDGRIVTSGGFELVEQLDSEGYEEWV